ncbi:Transposase IS200 like protein [Phycisphaerae bacterium RAS1]|nr:Transposase IS200 like protein [Phycisphaerae bacterium RAS1]
MRTYLRMHAPGGRFFLTLVTYQRAPILTQLDHVDRLRAALAHTRERRPFTVWGAVILPDHLHLLIELPVGDTDFSTRVMLIKSRFTPAGAGAIASPSRTRRRERAVWQRRFWEHTIRDESDFATHMDYIHYNPVKHGYATCPHAWPHSSFHRWVREGRYAADWACSCARPAAVPVTIAAAAATTGE